MQRGRRLAPIDAGAESSGYKLVVGLTPMKRKGHRLVLLRWSCVVTPTIRTRPTETGYNSRVEHTQFRQQRMKRQL